MKTTWDVMYIHKAEEGEVTFSEAVEDTEEVDFNFIVFWP